MFVTKLFKPKQFIRRNVRVYLQLIKMLTVYLGVVYFYVAIKVYGFKKQNNVQAGKALNSPNCQALFPQRSLLAQP